MVKRDTMCNDNLGRRRSSDDSHAAIKHDTLDLEELSRSSAILITGPTASGKSGLALRIARALNGVVVNADSMQVYSCWQILTARPDRHDQSVARHYLYGHVDKSSGYSVGIWLDEVRSLVGKETRVPIIVGGTGLYFKSLIDGLAPIPAVPQEIRERGMRTLTLEGPGPLIERLRRDDPATLGGIDTGNARRVLRAWEVLEGTGTGLHAWHRHNSAPLVRRSDSVAIVIQPRRDELAQRIQRRLESMLQDGVLEECRQVMRDWNPDLPYAKALGAAEFIDHINGNIELSEALSRVARITRRFAKRQQTWFRAHMADWTRIASSSVALRGQ